VGQANARIRIQIGVKLVVAENDKTASLIVEHNPTMMTIRSNIHPAAFIDPATRLPVICPSSHWAAMDRNFRLGFEFLAAVAKGKLFDENTQRAFQRGDIHLVRVEWAAAKPVQAKRQFLQLLTVVYDPTIARGSGIINNATHLGLEFKPRINRETHDLDGVRIRKFHGNKSVFSVGLDDKEARADRMSGLVLTEAQAATVKQSLREDIKVHSEGILILARKAQRKLKSWGEDGLDFFNSLDLHIFLQEEPQATLWWLQRSVFILSHEQRGQKLIRRSFGVWLLPFIEHDVLHFDLIAHINANHFHQLCRLSDPVAVAWRCDKVASREGWAARLGKIAKVSDATVYNWRDLWRDKLGIDIAFPLQLYSDILHFGQASTTRPEKITEQLVAVKNEDAETVLRIYVDSLADFEHKRLTILNPALLAPPRALPLEGPPGVRPDLDVDDDALEDGDLSEVDLRRAKPKLSAAKAKGTLKLGKKVIKSRPPASRKLGLPKPRSNS
jgi:hypothetical protein